MQNLKRVCFYAFVFALAGASVAVAQMGMRAPQLQGVWNPVVGSGAAYQIENKGERAENKSEIEIAIVDSETVDGKTGYWLEYTIRGPHSGGEAYMKHLVLLADKDIVVQRMIMQVQGMPQPVEMSMETARQSGRSTEQAADMREKAERVGSESLTTPAGTFQCEHWRMKDGSADVWFSAKVSPWGVVKMTGKESNMTLVRLIADARTHITGTPMKMDPMEMLRRRRNP